MKLYLSSPFLSACLLLFLESPPSLASEELGFLFLGAIMHHLHYTLTMLTACSPVVPSSRYAQVVYRSALYCAIYSRLYAVD